jgi:hypothetical protein
MALRVTLSQAGDQDNPSGPSRRSDTSLLRVSLRGRPWACLCHHARDDRPLYHPSNWTDRQSQERKESTSFFDVVAWGTLAENAATSLAKGTRVVVTGRLDQRSWETAEGDKRSKVEITADELAPSLRWATVQVTRNERHSFEEPSAADEQAA